MVHITLGPLDPLSAALQISVATRLHFPKAGVSIGKLYAPWSSDYCLVQSSAQ